MIGQEINLGSPKQLQVVLFDELGMPKTKRTKTGYTTDADALQALYAQTEHPFLMHLLRHRDVEPAAADGRGAAQDRSPTTGASTRRSTRRSPRPAGCPAPTPTCRTSRSAPRRAAGSARRSSSAQGYDVPADRRLQPDRDADHGAPVRGRRADRGVPARARTSTRSTASRVFGVPSRPRSRRSSGAKIKAMNYGLAYGLSAFGLGQQLGITPDEARGLMDEYFERFGGVRDYLARASSTRPAATGYTETMLGPAPLPARPDQRQPAAPRDGRADGAQRADPGLGRRHHQGRDARASTRALRDAGLRVADAAAGARRAGVRGRAGRARRAWRSWCAARWARADRARVPLDVSVGVGRTWDDAGH